MTIRVLKQSTKILSNLGISLLELSFLWLKFDKEYLVITVNTCKWSPVGVYKTVKIPC